MSVFQFSKPDPHDGRFDDIDDEDPMEGVEVSEHLLHPKEDAKETQAGARKTHNGDRERCMLSFFGDTSSGVTEIPVLKLFSGFMDRGQSSKGHEPRSNDQSSTGSKYQDGSSSVSADIFARSNPHEFGASSSADGHSSTKESDSKKFPVVRSTTPEVKAASSDQFDLSQKSDAKKADTLNKGSFSHFLEPKETSNEPYSEDSVHPKSGFSSIFGPKKSSSSSKNFVVEKYDQPPKVKIIKPDQCSSMPSEFLVRLRRGKGRSQRGYYRTVDPLPLDTPKPENHTRFVCVSDTHNEHDDIELPEGDVLLHCGDFTLAGRLHEVDDFNKWLGEVPYEHKIVIAGNHELSFDPTIMEKVKTAKQNKSYVRFGTYLKPIQENDWRDIRSRLTNCTYLEDGEVTINGIRIWGSPWQPEFGGWGFNVSRGKKILEKWDKIPDDIDILITHGPPAGHGDKVLGGQPVGCVDLLNTIQLRVQPKYHLFGHIHESYGISTDKFTTYVNCSSVNYHYEPVHKPIIFDLPNKTD